MKFKLLLITLFIFNLGYSQEDKLVGHELKYVEKIISIFKQNNIDAIVSRVNLPLKRETPIPVIKDEKELKLRFKEVFDEKLMDTIANSKAEQWSKVGGKGIMFEDGILWIDSVDGRIIGINHIGASEQKFLDGLLDTERENLFPSLREFQTSIFKIRTPKLYIRIDELSDSKYRYASWGIDMEQSTEPELVLTDGKMEMQGSEGNLAITFTNGNQTYTIFRNVTGQENRSEITLIVQKGQQIILAQDGRLVMAEE